MFRWPKEPMEQTRPGRNLTTLSCHLVRNAAFLCPSSLQWCRQLAPMFLLRRALLVLKARMYRMFHVEFPRAKSLQGVYVVYYGNPVGQSPFVQCHLPAGFKHRSKKSRCVSYMDAGGSRGPKSATRSKDQALSCLRAWSLEWYESLSVAGERTGLQKASHALDYPHVHTMLPNIGYPANDSKNLVVVRGFCSHHVQGELPCPRQEKRRRVSRAIMLLILSVCE